MLFSHGAPFRPRCGDAEGAAGKTFGDVSALRQNRRADATTAASKNLGALADALLDRTRPKPDWTREAHLGATLYLLAARRDLDLDLDLDAELPVIIRRDNEAVGTPNTDTSGYHETLTRLYLRLLRRVLADAPAGEPLDETFSRLLASPAANGDITLSYLTKSRLFSPEARRFEIAPDLAAYDF